MHTLTATLTLDGAPVVGQRLYFTVEGANPQTYDDVTDALGQVQFSYVGNNVGTDTVSVTSVAGGKPSSATNSPTTARMNCTCM